MSDRTDNIINGYAYFTRIFSVNIYLHNLYDNKKNMKNVYISREYNYINFVRFIINIYKLSRAYKSRNSQYFHRINQKWNHISEGIDSRIYLTDELQPDNKTNVDVSKCKDIASFYDNLLQDNSLSWIDYCSVIFTSFNKSDKSEIDRIINQEQNEDYLINLQMFHI